MPDYAVFFTIVTPVIIEARSKDEAIKEAMKDYQLNQSKWDKGSQQKVVVKRLRPGQTKLELHQDGGSIITNKKGG